MKIMNIAGVLLHINPSRESEIKNALLQMAGTEIHAIQPDGRWVVTVEGDDNRQVADIVMNLHRLAGVLSAAMIYQHSEEVEEDTP